MNTRQLYYLVTVAEFGNLSRAARALELSQPALSRFLLSLEQRLGVTLFLRHHSQLTPTAIGEYIIDHAQKILDEQNRMLLTMRAVTGRDRSSIRLATAPNRAAIVYSKIFNPFTRRFPDVALQLTELYASEQPGAIQRGQIDLALGSGEVSERVTDIPIATEELLIALPVSHPLAGQPQICLSDLQDTPFVLQSRRDSIRRIADRLFRQADFEPVVAFESGDVRLLDSMMHQAVGAGFVSAAHVLPCEELVYRPLDPPVHQTLHIRYPAGRTLTDSERYLASLLIRERLADDRYKPVDSPEANALYAAADLLEEQRVAAPARAGRTHQPIQTINLDSKVLEYLIAIVEEKSLTAAAERFYLAQPVLSRYLRNMERMVDTPLFTREHNRLAPTNAGKVFVNNARNILHIETELFEYVRAYRRGHGGNFYLSCDPSLIALLREKVQPVFASEHPEIELRIVEANSEDTLEALLGANSDFGLYLSNESSHPFLECQVLALTELVYCCDYSNPLPDAPVSMAPAGRSVMLSPTGTTLRAEQERLLAAYFDPPPQVVCEAQFPILQRLVESGGADIIMPLHLISRERYVQCRPFEPPQPLYLLLAWNASRHMPPAAHDLIRHIGEAYRNAFALQPEPTGGQDGLFWVDRVAEDCSKYHVDQLLEKISAPEDSAGWVK